ACSRSNASRIARKRAPTLRPPFATRTRGEPCRSELARDPNIRESPSPLRPGERPESKRRIPVHLLVLFIEDILDPGLQCPPIVHSPAAICPHDSEILVVDRAEGL